MSNQEPQHPESRTADTSTVLRSLVAISRRGLVDARYDDAPLSITDQSIVMAIAQQPGIRSIDVARMFRLNRSTVSRQVAGLVALGLVRGVPSESRRRRPLELTAEGASACEGTLDTLRRVIETQLASWSDDEVARFAHDLDRFDRAHADRGDSQTSAIHKAAPEGGREQ